MLKEAMYWETDGDRIFCKLCPQACRIPEGKQGLCRMRENQGGKLFSLNYGRIASSNMDPIEKKPLFHFFPGKKILSLGTLGCNLKCLFCQNWEISQNITPTQELLPSEALRLAKSYPENIGIAYTYNEPLIWYEYILETSRLIREAGLKNVVVTNGEICEEPLRALLPTIDALNIDLKSIDPQFYTQICKGPLNPVLRTIQICHEEGCHVEITNLLVPGKNDSAEQVQKLVDWVAELDSEIPLHFSRYFPAYKMTDPPTPLENLDLAYKIARQKLPYVYLGNILDMESSTTYCSHCHHPVIKRWGMGVREVLMEGSKCQNCGESIPIVWK